jgi:hypothetical protein
MKKLAHLSIVILIGVNGLSGCAAEQQSAEATGELAYELSAEEIAFLDTLQHRTFLYFWNECNPHNGLIKDRSTEKSPASIAAVGFGVAAWAVGVERGWITREQAVERTLTLLNFLMNSDQSTDTLATGHRGFYYHFLDMKTAQRVWKCELSTIDTAWLLAGIRFASQYYGGSNSNEQRIRALADSLTFRVDWDWMTLPEDAHHPNVVSMSWRQERGGVQNYGWTGLNEGLYLYILAAGSGHSSSEKAYKSWLSYYQWDEPYEALAHVVFPPLFGHQYSQMFVDFRGLADEYMQEKRIDYFENSRRATLTQRRYAIDNPAGWAGYDSLVWGLTACDGPGPSYNREGKRFHTYSARGTSGPDHVHNDDGTIAPTAAGGSIVFAPEFVLPTLRAMYDRYGDKGLWGRYGFVDAFNPTVGWFDRDYLGIDQGPILLMIENLRTGMIWEYSMRDPVIKRGLQRLGFVELKNSEKMR